MASENLIVVPAKAGIQFSVTDPDRHYLMPVSTGMTKYI